MEILKEKKENIVVLWMKKWIFLKTYFFFKYAHIHMHTLIT